MALRKKARKFKKHPETLQLEGEERMGGAEEMSNLCQEIAGSFDARVASVAALRQETAVMLKDIRARLKDIRARQEERNEEVASTLGGFRREREAAGAHWQGLAATMAKRRASFAR